VTAPGPFSVAVSSQNGMLLAAPGGELDLSTAPVLAEAVGSVPAGGLVLDLRGLQFMDSSGIRLLFELDARARAEGWPLAVVRGPGPVAEVLELCRIDERVRVIDGPEEAGW
jgi:anti-anti-sigma factor